MSGIDHCRRCDRPVRFDGPFCSDECRESHEAECDDDECSGTYVKNPDHKPSSDRKPEDLGIGEDLKI